MSTLRSSSASGISGSSSGAGLLRASLKYSTQRASRYFSEVRSCPCLFRMGTFLLPIYFPQINLVILKTFLCSPFCAASSASYAFLSVRIFLLTRLLVSAYAALYLTRGLADLLSIIVFFSWRLSSIACHSGVIHSFFFLVFCIPRQVLLALSEMFLTCFHC